MHGREGQRLEEVVDLFPQELGHDDVRNRLKQLARELDALVASLENSCRRLHARYIVDITSVIDQKERMLSAHDSQRSWLREQHGEDEYLRWMRRSGSDRARDLNDPAVQVAEGFVPHLGHGFPREDFLTPALGSGHSGRRRWPSCAKRRRS